MALHAERLNGKRYFGPHPERIDGKLTLYGSYAQHKRDSRTRGIAFELSFELWVQIWFDSGKLYERGRNLGQYVMARFGDEGPYAYGNVEIISASQNHVDGNVRKETPKSIRTRQLRARRCKERWARDGKRGFGHGA